MKANIFVRVLFVGAGLVFLALVTVGSLGTALLALVIVAVAWGFQRRHGRRLTLIQAWFVSAGSATLVIAAGLAWYLTRPVPGTHLLTYQSMERITDSVAAHPAPMPEYMRYLPGASPSGQVPVMQPPAALRGPLTIFTEIIGAEIFGVIVGSVAWASAWLILYGIRGTSRPISLEIALPAE